MDEHRQSPRYRLRWDAALIPQGQEHPLCRGKTHDISRHGVAVLTDYNVALQGPFKVLLLAPPLFDGQPPQLIEATAQKIYCVHSADHLCFRTGFHFVRFQEAGEKILYERLKQHTPHAGVLPEKKS